MARCAHAARVMCVPSSPPSPCLDCTAPRRIPYFPLFGVWSSVRSVLCAKKVSRHDAECLRGGRPGGAETAKVICALCCAVMVFLLAGGARGHVPQGGSWERQGRQVCVYVWAHVRPAFLLSVSLRCDAMAVLAWFASWFPQACLGLLCVGFVLLPPGPSLHLCVVLGYWAHPSACVCVCSDEAGIALLEGGKRYAAPPTFVL